MEILIFLIFLQLAMPACSPGHHHILFYLLVTGAPLLNYVNLTGSSLTFDPHILMVAPEVVSSRDISVSLMVCGLPKLDGTNVPHGLGVAWGILLPDHGLFSWSKTLNKKHASLRILRGNT